MTRNRTRTALAALAMAGLLTAGCGSSSGGASGDASGDAKGDTTADERPAQSQRADGARGGAAAEDDAGRQEPKPAPDRDAAPDGKPSTAPRTLADGGTGAKSAAAEPPWCRTSAFSASVRALNPAAGNRYAALVLTNTSDQSCRTRGWPGLQLVNASGTDLPTEVVRDRGRAAEELTVAPGASVWSRLHWTVVSGGGACTAKPAEIEVIPPDTYRHTDTAWRLGKVCDAGRIEALPLAAGDGPAR